MKYLREFVNHSAYEAAKDSLALPNVSFCVQEEEVHYAPESDYSTKYLTFKATESGTFKFSGVTGNDSIDYSLDNGSTWVTLASDTDSPTVNAGDIIMWKGELTAANNGYGCGRFYSTGEFEVEGNIMSLIFGDDFIGQNDLTGYDTEFVGLFNKCTSGLTNAENLSLPATTLSPGCYYAMFNNCKKLVGVPKVLPASTVGNSSYMYMFLGCTSITDAPEIQASTVSAQGCTCMFSGCTSLVNVPDLVATNVGRVGYMQMFQYCTSLETAPEISATTVGNQALDSMFSHCTSLTTAPSILPATTLGLETSTSCYHHMFEYCSSLTRAPELPAVTLVPGCYEEMFYHCTNLNYVKCLATGKSGVSGPTDRWLSYTAENGTFVAPSGVEWSRDYKGVPSSWTIEYI